VFKEREKHAKIAGTLNRKINMYSPLLCTNMKHS